MFNTNTKIRVTGLKEVTAMIDAGYSEKWAFICFNTRLMHVWVDGRQFFRNTYTEDPNNVYIGRETLNHVSSSVGANIGTRKELEAVILTILTSLSRVPNRSQSGLSDRVNVNKLKAAAKLIESSMYYWVYFDIATSELLVEPVSNDWNSPRLESTTRLRIISKPMMKYTKTLLWSGASTETVLKEAINLIGEGLYYNPTRVN